MRKSRLLLILFVVIVLVAAGYLTWQTIDYVQMIRDYFKL
jgi:hypothetical protein